MKQSDTPALSPEMQKAIEFYALGLTTAPGSDMHINGLNHLKRLIAALEEKAWKYDELCK